MCQSVLARWIEEAEVERPSLTTHLAWSALGPYGTGDRWSSTGTNGHGRHTETAGHREFRPQPRGVERHDGGFEPLTNRFRGRPGHAGEGA